jgi:hypothetical protein
MIINFGFILIIQIINFSINVINSSSHLLFIYIFVYNIYLQNHSVFIPFKHLIFPNFPLHAVLLNENFTIRHQI